jgi:hypothetical protein
MPLTPTPPGVPTGHKPEDGFRTLLTCSLNPTIQLWQVGVKPPGLDAGDMIDTTTMHNATLRTRVPRKLITTTDATATVTYDPAVYPALLAVVGKNTAWTVTFWDLSSLTFNAALRTFEPAEITEGTQPRATVTVSPGNQDPATGAETAFLYTAPPAGGGAPMAPQAASRGQDFRPEGNPPEVPEGVDFASTYQEVPTHEQRMVDAAAQARQQFAERGQSAPRGQAPASPEPALQEAR